MQDIRWVQRLQNYKRANSLLQSSLTATQPSQLVTGRYYSILWNGHWTCLESPKGPPARARLCPLPRQDIKQGFQAQIIKEGRNWIKALEDRNLTVHTYDETKAQEVELDIRNMYAPLIKQLVSVFEEQAEK